MQQLEGPYFIAEINILSRCQLPVNRLIMNRNDGTDTPIPG